MSHSNESSTYPTNMLLSISNVSNWDHNLKMKLTAYPDIGSAIRKGTAINLVKPTIHDLIEDSDLRMYNLPPDGATLTESSLNNYVKTKSTYEKRDQHRRDEEAKVCHLILSSLSEEAHMHLRTVEAFNKATNDNDSFAMYTIAKDQHARSTSFAVAQSTFRNLLNITKTGSFAQLIHDLEDEKRKFGAIFDRDNTGTVEINDIWVMVLVNSLPDDEFSFMKETLYAKDLSANFPQYSVVLNKKKATPKQEPSVQAGPSALSAASALPAKIKCGICSKMFPRTLHRITGEAFTNCFDCSRKAEETREARLATVTNPTLLKSQALKHPSK